MNNHKVDDHVGQQANPEEDHYHYDHQVDNHVGEAADPDEDLRDGHCFTPIYIYLAKLVSSIKRISICQSPLY